MGTFLAGQRQESIYPSMFFTPYLILFIALSFISSIFLYFVKNHISNIGRGVVNSYSCHTPIFSCRERVLPMFSLILVCCKPVLLTVCREYCVKKHLWKVHWIHLVHTVHSPSFLLICPKKWYVKRNSGRKG